MALAFVIDQTVASRAERLTSTNQQERQRRVDARKQMLQRVVTHNFGELERLRRDAEGHAPEATLRWFDATIKEATWRLTAFSPASNGEQHLSGETAVAAAAITHPSLVSEFAASETETESRSIIDQGDNELVWPPPLATAQQIGSAVVFARRPSQ